MTVIRDYNPADGDLCQGDVILFRLPDDYIPSKSHQIKPRDNKLILAEGEATGHHHAIWMQPLTFHDGGLAHEKIEARFKEKDVSAAARLYRDDALIQRLASGGHLTTTALAIGVLSIEGEPAVLRHQEHDAIRIPPGDYYVGRQQEFHAGEERRVAD